MKRKSTSSVWLNAQMAVDLWSLRSQKLKIRPLLRRRRQSTKL